MSEASKLLTSLQALRTSIAEPVSQMELIRRAVAGEKLRLDTPQFPLPLDMEQRKFMEDNIARLESFLTTEDGADALELLMSTFKEHCTAVVR